MTSAPTLSRAPAQPVGRLREMRAGVVVRIPPGVRVQQRQPPHERAPAACRPMPRRSPRARPRRSDSRPAGPAAGTWPMSSGRSLCSWCLAPRRCRADGRTRPECNKRERFRRCSVPGIHAGERSPPPHPGGLSNTRRKPGYACQPVLSRHCGLAGPSASVAPPRRLPTASTRRARGSRPPSSSSVPSSSRVLLVIPSLAVRSRPARPVSLTQGRLDSKTRGVAGAGAVSRSDGGGRGHGPDAARDGPTPSGRTNDDGGHSGQLLQDHRRAGGSPDRRPGLRAHRGQGGEIDVKAGDPVYDAQGNQAKDVHGLRDTYPVYHVSELNIAELRPRTPPASSDRAIEAQNTEFAEQLKVRGEAPPEPDEAERATLVVPKEIGKVPHDILRGQRGRAPARPGQLRACRRLAGGRVQGEVGRGGRGSRQVLAAVGVDATGSKPRRLSAPDSRGGSCRCSSGRWPQGRAARTAAASRPPRRPHAQGRAASCTSAAARRGRRSVP